MQVGYYVGARKPDKAQRLVQKSRWLSLASSESLIFLLFAFCHPVFSLFTHDPAVLGLLHSILAVELFLEAGRAINLLMIRALLNADDTAFPL